MILPMSTDTIQKTENSTVSKPRRVRYAETREREYLTESEVDAIIAAVSENRNAERDALMIRMMYAHALRITELVSLRWSQIKLAEGKIHINRVKGSDSGVHFLQPKEIRALKRLRADNPHADSVFISERGAQISERGFFKTIQLAGQKANLGFPVHPHMFRHSKGYQLVSKGTDLRLIQGYMGHKNIQNTVNYTKFDAGRMRGLEV